MGVFVIIKFATTTYNKIDFNVAKLSDSAKSKDWYLTNVDCVGVSKETVVKYG